MQNNSDDDGCLEFLGSIIAVVLSIWKWGLTPWVILHYYLGWFYVIFFVLRYVLHE